MPYLPTDRVDQFHLVVYILHTLAAITAASLALRCDTAQANQQAMIPTAIPLPPGSNISTVAAYRAAFPWSEDALFDSQSWNPYALIMAFEWITAGFALCNLRHFIPPARSISAAWMVLGVILVAAWFGSNSKSSEVCVAMLITLLLSFAAAGLQCELFYQNKLPHKHKQQDQHEDPHHKPLLPTDTQLSPEGRVWRIPRTIGGLKGLSENAELDNLKSSRTTQTAMHAVSFRYMEYWITAPLLFLAVISLLTVDAPAWLFLSGYWMIQACNAIGIALQGSVSTSILQAKPGDPVFNLMSCIKGVALSGTWREPWVNQMLLLNCAWLCLALPIIGLVYMTRGWLFSTDMPWIATVMIWNLLVSYTLFGVVPTVVYIVGNPKWILKLDWGLDILNLMAKFPLPILILIAFSTRPAGFHPCS